MTPSKLARSTIALSAIAMLAIGACGSSSSGNAATMVAPEPPPSLVSFMPQDSSVLVQINAGELVNSQLFKLYQEKLLKDAQNYLDEMKDKCGLDLLHEIQEFAVAVGADVQTPDDTVIAVRGNFKRVSMEACLTTMGGTVNGNTYTDKGNGELHAYWPSDNTMVVSRGRTSEQLMSYQPGANVMANAELTELKSKVDDTSTLWAVGLVPSQAAAMMGPMGAPPQSVYLSLNVTSGLDSKIGVIFATADEARSMSSMIDMGMTMAGQKPKFKNLAEAVTKAQEGNTIIMSLNLGAETINSLVMMATDDTL